MTFTVGETVVYPNHGAAVIEDIEMRKIKGENTQYLVLRIVAQQDLVVRVPACNLDLVGVRDVVDKEGLDRVFDVLMGLVRETGMAALIATHIDLGLDARVLDLTPFRAKPSADAQPAGFNEAFA